MSYADYDLNPLRLALDLASLGDGMLGFGQLLGRQRIMFTDHGYQPTQDAGLQRTLTRLGGQLAAALAEPSEPAFCDQLAALLEAQDCKPYLTRHDGTPHLHYARDGAPLAQWMSAMAVSGLVLYVCRHGRSRLRRCAAAGCGRWLVDTSRNQSRRYCTHSCATRTTVAAHRARRKAATP
ncbi:MAG: CGNR zinc finger domain-containing protein [Streptosporangiaceae bacterium]